jgi:hypothetical protein
MADDNSYVSDAQFVEKEARPTYKPVDYNKGTVDVSHLGRNKPDKVMAIEGGHAARSALDKNYLTCKATKGGSSCKPATTWWQAPGEYREQATAVCDKHADQLSRNALKREPNPDHFGSGTLPIPQTFPIKPKDVARDSQRTSMERAQLRTTMEMALYRQGMRGQDAIFGRKNIEVGKPGPEALFSPSVARSQINDVLEDVKNSGGHVSSGSKMREVDPETGGYIDEPRNPHYLRKRGAYPDRDPRPSVDVSSGGAEELKRKKSRGGKASPKVEEPPKPLANTFNSDGSQAYGHTVDQPIGFGAGDIDWHPEKYPLEVASSKAHKQIRPRGFSKTDNRSVEVTIGMPYKPEYKGGLAKFISEQKEKRDQAAIDFNSYSSLMMPGSSRALEFEKAQDEGRTPAIENVRKPKELG